MEVGNSVRSIHVQNRASTAIVVAMACLFGWFDASHAAEVRHQVGESLRPNGKGWGELDPSGLTEKNAAKFSKPTSNNGIFYHGGQLMLGTPNVYYIWYGNWTNDTATTLLPAFAGGLSASPYFQINSTYYDAANVSVSGFATFASQATDNYSQGTALTDAAVQMVVQNAISGGALPLDSNGVYFVLTSPDVNETSGFCTQYCAWHNHATINGANIKFGFVGNPARCPTACSGQQGATPNNNLGADGMANLIAHELSESVTDPNLDAWFDRRGYENADKCAWTFGTTKTASNGSKYNVTFGNYNWLVQQNWVNASGGYCALSK
jgi:Phosphate-induced protein 1 conserved region